jgi:hypothetical protein
MDSENIKKILCYNILNSNKCAYGNKCMFAHSLEEQKKDNYREFLINVILKSNDLSNINICEDSKLLCELLIFTKECKNCLIKKCNGGYNCKYGTCVSDLKICKNDLITGKCKKEINKENLCCSNGLHLTEKKIIPYNLQLYTYPNTNFLLDNNNNNLNVNINKMILNNNNIENIKDAIKESNINQEITNQETINQEYSKKIKW